VCCSFTSQQTNGEKQCIIEYGPEESTCTPPLLYKSESRRNTSRSLTADLPTTGLSHSAQSNRYCYIITASDGASVMKVKGLFNAGACLSTLQHVCRFYGSQCFLYAILCTVHTYLIIILWASALCACMCASGPGVHRSL
jgi:hypothetical protein